MNLNMQSIVDYIVNNYQTHYFDTLEFLKKNKSLLSRKIFEKIMVELYFSYSYNVSGRELSSYCPYFEISYKDFIEIERDIFISNKLPLPKYKNFLNFLSNDMIDFTLKNNYIASQNISEDYWYDLVIDSIKFGSLEKISEYLLKHLKPINFCFENKKNFYNFIISGDGIISRKTKSDYIKYIRLFKKIGFDINNKDSTGMVPLHNAIRRKEKQMIVSIIKYKPHCDIFFENNHLWNLYLEKFSYDEYNYNVYQYFLKNVSIDSLKTKVGNYYLAGRILNKSNIGNVTRDLIRKCFSFYNVENSFNNKSIREQMINHPRIGKLFREEEMIYLENKMIDSMKIKAKIKNIEESKTLRRRI